MTDLIPFRFHDDELLLVDVDGKPHIVLKPAFESIGLDAARQIAKVQRQPWATTAVTAVVAADGKRREMVSADVRTFLGALFLIPASRVAEHVRPKLISYQSEVADAIESYWTQGGAINPRASHDQLVAIAQRAESQAKVLSALRGVVDKGWLDAKGRHVAALAMGEEPEIDPATRPLTVGEYLESRGVTGKTLRSLSSTFGKRLKAEYVDRYDHVPTVADRFVDGALRPVAVYTEKHRPLFDRVWHHIAPDAA